VWLVVPRNEEERLRERKWNCSRETIEEQSGGREQDKIMVKRQRADASAWQGPFQPDGSLKISDAEN
jgi:hypothetical protein